MSRTHGVGPQGVAVLQTAVIAARRPIQNRILPAPRRRVPLYHVDLRDNRCRAVYGTTPCGSLTAFRPNAMAVALSHHDAGTGTWLARHDSNVHSRVQGPLSSRLNDKPKNGRPRKIRTFTLVRHQGLDLAGLLGSPIGRMLVVVESVDLSRRANLALSRRYKCLPHGRC